MSRPPGLIRNPAAICMSTSLRCARRGRTVVLTTHYIEEAHLLCDRVAIIDRGKVIAIGKPDDLIAGSKASLRVTIRAAKPLDAGQLAALPTVQHAETEDGRAVLKTANVSQTVIDVVGASMTRTMS